MSEQTKSKYIVGFLMILLSFGIYFGLPLLFGENCTGWQAWLNPLCWLDFVGDLAFMVLAIYTFVVALIILALPPEKTVWGVLFWFFGIGIVVSLVIPIPIIDTLVASIGTMFSGVKLISTDSGKKEIGLF